MVEVLPAPLGPSRPNTEPRATSKLRPSTAANAPKRLQSPLAVMTASIPEALPESRPEWNTGEARGSSA